jgi:hypothetical protein
MTLPGFDGMAELWFDDMAALDASRTALFLTEEKEIR